MRYHNWRSRSTARSTCWCPPPFEDRWRRSGSRLQKARYAAGGLVWSNCAPVSMSPRSSCRAVRWACLIADQNHVFGAHPPFKIGCLQRIRSGAAARTREIVQGCAWKALVPVDPEARPTKVRFSMIFFQRGGKEVVGLCRSREAEKQSPAGLRAGLSEEAEYRLERGSGEAECRLERRRRIRRVSA